MTLEQAAKLAMDYFDSVNAAAEWRVARVCGYDHVLLIEVGKATYYAYSHEDYKLPMKYIKKEHLNKSR